MAKKNRQEFLGQIIQDIAQALQDGLGKKAWFSRHRDDEFFDEIRLYVKPRYKTSGLSGDEWRISGEVQFFRKGYLVAEEFALNLETAVQFLPYWFVTLREKANNIEDRHLCFQPGCSEEAVALYRLKKEYCRRGHESVPHKPTVRAFCRKHLQRGDCGLEDADDNYEVVFGPGPNEARGWEDDESPAVFGGVIEIDPE